MEPQKVTERFFSYTKEVPDKNPWVDTPCLEWQGYRGRWGYGRFKYKGQTLAHRVTWLLAYGEIPTGALVLHICRNPACVNVDHLYLGTDADNMTDQIVDGTHSKTKKTHCPNGHEYTEENTKWVSIRKYKGVGTWQRKCRICIKETAQRWYQENKDRYKGGYTKKTNRKYEYHD